MQSCSFPRWQYQTPLSQDEELKLIIAWREHGDLASRHRLILAFMPLARKASLKSVRIAADRAGARLSSEDLTHQAVVGLLRAIDRFDPNMGYRFSTYARWWVNAEVLEYALDNLSNVKIGNSAQNRALYFAIPKALRAAEKAMQADGIEPSFDRMMTFASHQLGVTSKKFLEVYERVAAVDVSLNAPAVKTSRPDGTDSPDMIDLLADDHPTPEEAYLARNSADLQHARLHQAIAALKPREREVISLRWLNPNDQTMTLEQVGKQFGVSRERARQIEKAAIDKIKLRLQRAEKRSGPAK